MRRRNLRRNVHPRISTVFLLIAVFAFSFTADRATKYAACRLGWDTSFNSGVSFGLFRTACPYAVTAANIAIIFVLFVLCIRSACACKPLFCSGCGMMLGGAAGNLADRLARGHVIDWLPLPLSDILFEGGLWINAADAFLVLGSAAVLLDLWCEAKGKS